ncbi:MAG: M23 family metallopeptidase [Sphingomonadales bacterium]|nr:M23 family metallopeptidase [Sphingomonadales bacterium]
MNRSLALALGVAGAAAALAIGASVTRTSASAARQDIALVGELTQGGWARGTVPAGTVALTLDGKAVPLAPDGSFFVAFDRDAGVKASLVARFASGDAMDRTLAISPRAWKLEYIPIGPRPGTAPSEEFQRRRAAEVVQINAARAIDSHSQGWRQRFVWPVHGRISGLFGSQRIYSGTPGSYHSGTDIAGASGTPIAAPADGVVILAAASPFTLEGNLLMIDHGMGLNSAFLHCSQILVHEGEAVKQGQIIARIGMTGRATGPHLHWSIKWRDARLDPMLFTGPMN